MPEKTMTPMMLQYHEIKGRYPDSLLFYRMGDFYELFHDDAVTAAKVLDIALTKRGKEKDQDIPMCGVPFHAYESYLAKLVKAGFKVAICEQMEKPEEAKKRGYKSVVKRDVVRVVTPGTITEEHLLEQKDASFLLSIAKIKAQYSLAWADISTGDIYYKDVRKVDILDQIIKLNPKEILTFDDVINDKDLSYLRREYKEILANQSESFFSSNRTKRNLQDFYQVKFLDSLGSYTDITISALGSLTEYIKLTQINQRPLLKKPIAVGHNEEMQLDAATIINLELFSSTSGNKKNSLLYSIDNTRTAMGGRLIRQFICSPLTDLTKINARLDSVEYFYKKSNFSCSISDILKNIYDFERAIARLAVNRGGPRDLFTIRESLKSLKILRDLLEEALDIEDSKPLRKLVMNLNEFSGLIKELDVIVDSPPMLARDGGFVAIDACEEIRELMELKFHANDKMSELQERYRKETGVPNLRIKATNILGYYIEVGSQYAHKIDKTRFIHRQTLANATRFINDELLEIQEKLNSAEGLILAKEIKIYNELCSKVVNSYNTLSKAAKAVAYLDIFVHNSILSRRKSYTKPKITDSNEIEIDSGFHPVVKENLPDDVSEFINNDCIFKSGQILHLLTGPNMAGKSTYLRQNAIIILLAQAGFFVPAKDARIGVVDRIFSRIGASDDLSKGRSTFMMEMLETAAILNQATDKSFVILDEIGRGTATFDGMALASSIVEYLSKENKSRSLFATHYHELIQLEERIKDVKSFQVEVTSSAGNIIFKHRIKEGHAKKSYGIAVAKLAGLPTDVITNAQSLLDVLERSKPETDILPLFNANNHYEGFQKDIEEDGYITHSNYEKLKLQVLGLEIDEMTPREALNELYKIRDEVTNGT